MRYRYLFLLTVLVTLLISACGGSQSPPITPAQDRLTFLYFFING